MAIIMIPASKYTSIARKWPAELSPRIAACEEVGARQRESNHGPVRVNRSAGLERVFHTKLSLR
ncbi:MAG: hypothetical protein ACLFT2_04690, partial [Candidatus Brocadiia bacterium]